ncbi:hypothetical protein RJ639_007777 [Escallonia herrerae]|uniref:DM2 domain-containing protein n=1 Tax=Escallonia herrerae TaxID=1293975 RepID=A0AA88VW80_9ASTE|nr:hypothetical protein RJ639_007777 [Escallonia herrerae]
MEKGEKEESFFWIEDSNEQLSVPIKVKRKVKAKKIEFVGWGSKPLIEFLESMGRDISIKLSQYEVTAIVNEYIHRNDLFHPVKKKRVMCDQWLHYLFGKKWVPRIKIYDLLEAHFAENHDESEDETFFGSEGEDDMVYKKQKFSSSDIKKAQQKKQVPETPKSCFASITSDNMKLVYLKRSLIQDLSKDPESFEVKVVGSYVRIKSDPNDYFQKNSHQLQQVAADVEECEDLRQRVKAGLANRPTVVELEQKARILHEDITKHVSIEAFIRILEDRGEKEWQKAQIEMVEVKGGQTVEMLVRVFGLGGSGWLTALGFGELLDLRESPSM